VLVQTVKLKLFAPGNKKFVTHRIAAGPGHHFTAENIEKILADFVDKVEAAIPGYYRMVQIGRGEFNFIHLGKEVSDAGEVQLPIQR
jgi:hypothetical protein